MEIADLRVEYLDDLTGQVFDLETYYADFSGKYITFTHKENPNDVCKIRKDELSVFFTDALDRKY